MERTPIKIPGKNKRDGRKAAVAARKALNRPRGRPLKVDSAQPTQDVATSASIISDAKKDRPLKHLKSRRKMSLLEKLPTELLETIFLYCLNLALPNCSPIIGGKLSSDATYTKTILAAFDPTWEAYLGTLVSRFDREHYEPPGDAALQSAILRLRWARLPVVLRSKDTWRERYAPDRVVASVNTSWEDVWGNGENDENYRYNVVSAVRILDNSYAKYLEVIKTAKEEASKEEASAEVLNNSLQLRGLFCVYLDVAEGTQIPTSLLMGPWDEDALKYLFWFVSAGARIDWVSSTSGETLIHVQAALFGYKDAVAEGRIEVVALLLYAGVQEKLGGDLAMFTFKHAPASRGFPGIVALMYRRLRSESPIYDLLEVIDLFRKDPDNEHEVEKIRSMNRFIESIPEGEILR
ncbi:actin cortical patch protein [Rutstroemia sp. NJR-2017a WRK4]|nr:actin cortical patch protein [Rutstroemia sp. NJR-2017a WRK4]